MAAVAFTRNDSFEDAIDEALRHMPLEQLVQGKIVAVKPNESGITFSGS